ncbi:MAG: hypothetical protein V9F04_13395 [Dermatophilaceae bacterium]
MINWNLPWIARGPHRPRSSVSPIGAWQGFWVAYVGMPGLHRHTRRACCIFRGDGHPHRRGDHRWTADRASSASRTPVCSVSWRYAGAADMLTLVIGVVAIIAFVFSQLRTAPHHDLKHDLRVEPAAMFLTKLVGVVGAHRGVHVDPRPERHRHALRADPRRGADLRLRLPHGPHGLRSAHLRDRWQRATPPCSRASTSRR